MNCSSCGIQLPPGAKVCPNCGTHTPTFYANPETPPYNPPSIPFSSGSPSESSPSNEATILASPSSPPSPPSTGYGSNYYAPPSTPYGYQDTVIPPPPPPPQPSITNVIGQTGTQPSYPPPVTPIPTGPQEQKGPRRFPPGTTVLLIILAVLLIGGGGGLFYYTSVYQPNQRHIEATATAVAQIKGTANANATSTAQTAATIQAQVNGTSTAVAQVTAQAQATATALQNIYTQATSGTPSLNDPLKGQDSFNWDEFAGNPGGGCAFTGGAYHSSAVKGYNTPCFANATNFSNFAFQVDMTIINGQSASILFRSDSAHLHYYSFNIQTDGSYFLYRVSVDSAGNTTSSTLVSGSSSAIKTGANQLNLITVVARGSNFYLYVNKQYVDSASDGTNSSGQIGVNTVSTGGSVEAAFSNAQVWKI